MVTLKELSDRITIETKSLLNRIIKNKKDSDTKFSAVDTKIVSVNSRVDATNSTVSDLGTSLSGVGNRVTTVENSLAVKLYDSGPIPIVFTAGTSAYAATYQKLGDRVELDGGVSMAGLTAGVYHVVANLPANFRPIKFQYYPASAEGSTTVVSLRIGNTGDIGIRLSEATTSSITLTGVRFRSTKPII